VPTPAHPVHRRAARATRGALVVLCLALSGCLVVDATLKDDGSGTLQMSYPLAAGATAESEKARFTSADVTVESVNISGAAGNLKAAFRDVTKLSSAEGFRDVKVTRTREGNAETLSVVITKQVSGKAKDSVGAGPRFTITFPGKVLEANHDGKISDNKVAWSFTMSDYVKDKTTELRARYEVKAEGAMPGAPAKPAAPAAASNPAAAAPAGKGAPEN
jgi:hypothetical protein